MRKGYAAGALTLVLLGCSVLLGWFARIEPLVVWLEGAPAAPANGALALILFGIAFLAQAHRNRMWAALAIVPAAAGVLTLQQFYLDSNLGFDEWLLPHRFDGSEHPGRLAPALAACFILGGMAVATLVLGRTGRHRPFGLAVVGSLISATGFAEIAGHLTGLEQATKLGLGFAVPLPMAVGTLVLGTTIVMLGVLDRPRSLLTPPRWVPVALAVGCATATAIFWLALRQRETDFRRGTLQLSANNFAFALSAQLDGQMKALTRISAREAFGDDYPERIRQADALALVRDFPAVHYVAWLDTYLRARRLQPTQGNEMSLGLDHGADPTRRLGLERAKHERRAVVCGPLLPQLNQPVFMLYVPIYRREQLAGFLAAEVGCTSLLAQLDAEVRSNPDDTASVSISEIRVHGMPPDGTRLNSPDVFDDFYNVQGLRTRITFARRARSGVRELFTLSNIVFGAGLGVSVLVGLVVALAQRARHRQRVAEETNQKLERENHERRQVEGKLKLSEERLMLALESSQVGVFDWNVATGKVHFSPGIWMMLGYAPGAMAPSMKGWDDLIHPNDRPRVQRDFRRGATAGSGYAEAEYRVRTRFGEWFWVLERSKCVSYAPDGSPLRVTGTFQDVTSRKNAEEALLITQIEARKLAVVASVTDNLVLIADAAGRIEWANESFSRHFEYALGEVYGRSLLEFLAGPNATPEQAKELGHALQSPLPFTSEIAALSAKGREFHLHLELQPAANEQGEVEKYIAVLYDITIRLETERALRRAKSEAEATTRAKSEFLASMSHEIRTPMNGVIALSRLLLESPLNHEQQDWVRTIQSSGDALLTIINDILDFSKIESGRLEIEHHPFVLADCIEESLELFAVPSGVKGLELAYYIAPEVPAKIESDVIRLRQVLMNLVGNAVKFTPKGDVSIEVLPGETPEMIVFNVRDTGIGIPEERIAHLFQPFSQVDSSITRKFGGTGLGLAICKRLVELMGGAISLSSRIGVGTHFQFSIRARTVAEEKPALLPPPSRTALLLDDNPIVRRFLALELSRAGYACRATSDKAAFFAALDAGVKPDLVCIDAEQPEGTGLQLAAEIRQRAGTAASACLILSRTGQSPSSEQMAAAGVRGFLTKPLRRQPVRERANEAGAGPPASRAPTPQKPAAVSAAGDSGVQISKAIPLRILLAEDNPVNKKVALRLLERLGYTANAVVNGLEALHAVEAGNYQLVFMDVQMPEMDGLEATRRIRANVPKERQPIIVALTANALAGDAKLCRDAGMDDYVTKPVRPEDIHNAIVRQFGAGTDIPLLQ